MLFSRFPSLSQSTDTLLLFHPFICNNFLIFLGFPSPFLHQLDSPGPLSYYLHPHLYRQNTIASPPPPFISPSIKITNTNTLPSFPSMSPFPSSHHHQHHIFSIITHHHQTNHHHHHHLTTHFKKNK